MENIIDEVELEMDADIPEPEHIETILEGLGDSLVVVSGTEGLTNAQHYLGSVLVANGYLNRNQVGQEGIFKSVGDGFKAALAYVKKMFTNLYEFFFKRDAPKLTAEAKQEVKETEEVVKVLETGGSTEEETTKALTNMRKVVLALTHEPDVNKAALEQILKEADEAMKGSQADKKKVVLQIGRDLPKLNKRSQTAIKKRVDEIIRILTATDKVVGMIIEKGEASIATPTDKHMAEGMKKLRPGLLSDLALYKKASGEPTAAELKNICGYVSKTIADTETGHKALAELKTQIQNDIKTLESGKDEEGKKAIASLKSLLSSVSAMVQCGKEALGAGKALLRAGSKAFGY